MGTLVSSFGLQCTVYSVPVTCCMTCTAGQSDLVYGSTRPGSGENVVHHSGPLPVQKQEDGMMLAFKLVHGHLIGALHG